MIIVCELYHRAGAHAPFNAGLLQVIQRAFPAEQILFFGERLHVESVREQVGPGVAGSIEWQVVALDSRKSGYAIRFWRDLVTLGQIAGRLHGADGECRLVVTSFDSPRLLALKLIARMRLRRVQVQVVSHGEIAQGSVGGRHRHPWKRFWEIRTALALFRHSSIQYLVLESGIQERILEVVPSLAGSVEVLDHPLPPNERSSSARNLEVPVRFGFLGVANEAKGFPSFLELAAEISEKYPGKAEFHLVGRLPSGHDGLGLEWLAEDPRSERLSRDRYVEKLRRLHFVVMPFRSGCYELTPSGTLLDAIAWQIPIIATRLPLFERLFADYGDIGYLFGTDGDAAPVLEQLLRSPDRDRFATQVDNMRRLHTARAPEKLAIAYQAICARHKVQASECVEVGVS